MTTAGEKRGLMLNKWAVGIEPKSRTFLCPVMSVIVWCSISRLWVFSDSFWFCFVFLFVIVFFVIPFIFFSFYAPLVSFLTTVYFSHSPTVIVPPFIPFLTSVILDVSHCKLFHIFFPTVCVFLRQKTSHLGLMPTRLAILFCCIPRRFEIKKKLNLFFMDPICWKDSWLSGKWGLVIVCFSYLFFA